MCKLFKFLSYLCAVLVGSFAVFLAYMTFVDYTPEPEEQIASNDHPTVIKVNEPLTFMTWNIGYAGLDAKMDFFYDGGTQVFPTEAQSQLNLSQMASYVHDKKPDFLLVQEIDVDARRSYGMNQVDTFAKAVGCSPLFASNYSVKWVPLPLIKPMGNVESGIAQYSNYVAADVRRYSFPVNFSWPLKVFMLDRCFMVSRFPTADGRELLVIVTHNSAFDDGGELRKAELGFFRDFVMREFEKGNYVVAGGDFNQCPAHFEPSADDLLFDRDDDFHTIPDTLFPSNWNFVYDRSNPTNRRVVAPYDPKKTKTSLIDFFITSPNVKVVGVSTDNLAFANSDHNPVWATLMLGGNN